MKTLGTRLTFRRYEGFAVRGAPSHLVYLRNTEITPEVLTAVVIKALVPQESLEPCGRTKTHGRGDGASFKLETQLMILLCSAAVKRNIATINR